MTFSALHIHRQENGDVQTRNLKIRFKSEVLGLKTCYGINSTGITKINSCSDLTHHLIPALPCFRVNSHFHRSPRQHFKAVFILSLFYNGVKLMDPKWLRCIKALSCTTPCSLQQILQILAGPSAQGITPVPKPSAATGSATIHLPKEALSAPPMPSRALPEYCHHYCWFSLLSSSDRAGRWVGWRSSQGSAPRQPGVWLGRDGKGGKISSEIHLASHAPSLIGPETSCDVQVLQSTFWY